MARVKSPPPRPPQALCLPLRLMYDGQGGMDCLTPAWLIMDEAHVVRLRVDARDFGYVYTSPEMACNKTAVKAAEKVAKAVVALANRLQPDVDKLHRILPSVEGWPKEGELE